MESNKLKVFVICLLITILVIPVGKAQTWDELFSQKKTQIRYLGEQIAALQVYISYAKKGYEIVGSGINTVRDIKNGEFNLHSAFIGSLKSVNPSIRSSAKVAEIITLQLAIIKSLNAVKGNAYLPVTDQEYISRVRKQVQEECSKDLEELLLVVTDGKVGMKDDERLKRLDKVYESMKDKSAFTQSFTGKVRTLITQRQQAENEAATAKKLYGITQ